MPGTERCRAVRPGALVGLGHHPGDLRCRSRSTARLRAVVVVIKAAGVRRPTLCRPLRGGDRLGHRGVAKLAEAFYTEIEMSCAH